MHQKDNKIGSYSAKRAHQRQSYCMGPTSDESIVSALDASGELLSSVGRGTPSIPRINRTNGFVPSFRSPRINGTLKTRKSPRNIKIGCARAIRNACHINIATPSVSSRVSRKRAAIRCFIHRRNLSLGVPTIAKKPKQAYKVILILLRNHLS